MINTCYISLVIIIKNMLNNKLCNNILCANIQLDKHCVTSRTTTGYRNKSASVSFCSELCKSFWHKYLSCSRCSYFGHTKLIDINKGILLCTDQYGGGGSYSCYLNFINELTYKDCKCTFCDIPFQNNSVVIPINGKYHVVCCRCYYHTKGPRQIFDLDDDENNAEEIRNIFRKIRQLANDYPIICTNSRIFNACKFFKHPDDLKLDIINNPEEFIIHKSHLIVSCMNLDAIKYAINNNIIDTSELNLNGDTILHIACSIYRYDIDVVKYLFENTDIKKLINKKNIYGLTALHLSMYSWNCEITKYLIINGADVNISYTHYFK